MAIGLVLGGGAPNLTLMSGALLALDEAGVDFKVITTTGAGMVVGLMYAAPRRDKQATNWTEARRNALRGTRDWGIDDAIYDRVPFNYRIFQKPGAAAEAWSQVVNPPIWSIPRGNRRQRMLGDTLALWSSVMSPSNLRPSSEGLCQPPPWIEMLVNFADLTTNLDEGDKKFRLTAYCIEDQDDATFNKHEITAEHFKAALAMPFIYAPYKLTDPSDGRQKTYLEGSAFSTLELNPEDVMHDEDVDTIIFMDLMGNRDLIAEPRWLLDAWGKSIISPLTRLAEHDLIIFKMKRDLHRIARQLHALKAEISDPRLQQLAKDSVDLLSEEVTKMLDSDYREDDSSTPEPFGKRTELLRMPFHKHVDSDQWPKALDWSHSNMSALFDYGYKTGQAFCAEHAKRLENSMMSVA